MGECLSVAFDARALAFLAAVVAVSCASTWAAIHYAHRRRILDLPGHRRSHRAPTPRGGGIAIVLAMLAAVAALPLYDTGCGSSRQQAGMIVAIALVALVGWIDDHRSLSARWRLLAHLLAAAIVLHSGIGALAIGGTSSGLTAPWTRAMTWGAWIAVAWSINLHNFMDGIDGILSTQALFVFGASAFLLVASDYPAHVAMLPLAFAAAVLGFLPYNFPRARIFMGDVGSGVVGLAIAVVLLSDAHVFALTTGAVLCSAFVTDATCTLLSRMLGGRRWYSAHREHLYQWLVRSGFSHARVVAFYMGWNVLVALPVALYMNRTPQIPMPAGLTPAVAVYTLAVTAWWIGKRWCLRRVRQRSAHAAA